MGELVMQPKQNRTDSAVNEQTMMWSRRLRLDQLKIDRACRQLDRLHSVLTERVGFEPTVPVKTRWFSRPDFFITKSLQILDYCVP